MTFYNACMFFWMLLDPLFSLSVSSSLLGRFFVLSFQTAASIGISNFFRAIFMVFLSSPSSGSTKVDTSQLSRIIELLSMS